MGIYSIPAPNQVLTGFSSATGTLGATDTILQAINKLNGNIGLCALLGTTQSFTKTQSVTPVALTISANAVAVNLALSNNFTLTLQATTAQAISTPSNAVAGTSGQIAITQNATPSTLTFAAEWISTDGTTQTVSTTANAVNLLSYYVVDSTHVWFTLNKHGVA